MFCRSCGYNLHGSNDLCPECGTRFRPELSATWLNRPNPSAISAGLRSFGGFFILAAVYAVTFYFATGLVPEAWHGFALIVSVCILTIAFIVIVSRRPLWPTLLSGAVGVSWGFLTALSVAVSIQNARMSINWPAMLPGLVVVPITIALLASPFVFIQRLMAKRRARQALTPYAA